MQPKRVNSPMVQVCMAAMHVVYVVRGFGVEVLRTSLSDVLRMTGVDKGKGKIRRRRRGRSVPGA